MNINTTIKCIGAAAVLSMGLSAPSIAFARGGHGGGYGGGYKGHGGSYKGHGGSYKGGGYYGGRHGGYYGGRHGGYYGGRHGGYYGGRGHYGGHYRGSRWYYGGRYYSSFYRYCRNWGFYNGDPACYRRFGGYYYDNADLGIKDLKFKDLGSKLSAEGMLVGLSGTEAVQLDLEATSDVRSSCGAANRLAAPLDIQSQGSRSLAVTESALDLWIEADDSADLAADLVDCPNARDVGIDDVQFLDARVEMRQGDKVLTLLCTFTVPTVDGDIAPEDVECSAF